MDKEGAEDDERHPHRRCGRDQGAAGAAGVTNIPQGDHDHEQPPPQPQPAELHLPAPSPLAAAAVVRILGIAVDLWCEEQFVDIDDPQQDRWLDEDDHDVLAARARGTSLWSNPYSCPGSGRPREYGFRRDQDTRTQAAAADAQEVAEAGPSSRRFHIERPRYSRGHHCPLPLSPILIRVGSMLVDLRCYERIRDFDPPNDQFPAAAAALGALSPGSCSVAPAATTFYSGWQREADSPEGSEQQRQAVDHSRDAVLIPPDVPPLPDHVIRIGSFLIDLRCYEHIDAADPPLVPGPNIAVEALEPATADEGALPHEPSIAAEELEPATADQGALPRDAAEALEPATADEGALPHDPRIAAEELEPATADQGALPRDPNIAAEELGPASAEHGAAPQEPLPADADEEEQGTAGDDWIGLLVSQTSLWKEVEWLDTILQDPDAAASPDRDDGGAE